MRRLYAVLYFLAFLLFSIKKGNASPKIAYNEAPNPVKNISRARLWSPYSTVSVELNANPKDVSASPYTILQDSLSDESKTSNDNDESFSTARSSPELKISSSASRQVPIISSIRHYKSRKAFSRTHNPSGSDTRTLKGAHSSAQFSTAGSVLTDLDVKKNDEEDWGDKEALKDYQEDQGVHTSNPRSTASPSIKSRNGSKETPLSPNTFIYGSPLFQSSSSRAAKPTNKLNQIITLLNPKNESLVSKLKAESKNSHMRPQNVSDDGRQLNLNEISNQKKPLTKNLELNLNGFTSGELLPKSFPSASSQEEEKSSSSIGSQMVGQREKSEQISLGMKRWNEGDFSRSTLKRQMRVRSHYDDEIPLVFIPGVVPSFDESEDGSYEDEESGLGNQNQPSPLPDSADFEEDNEKSHGQTPASFLPNNGLLPPSKPSNGPSDEREDMDIVTKFLRMVEEKTADNCTAGTDLTLGQGVVDRYAQERFQREAEVAVNRANMLTRLWKYAREVMNSEYLLHASVFSMVEFDDNIFAAGNCYDERQYKNYTLFCPFAYRLPDGNILVKDLAVEYKYLTNTSEFFYAARTNAERVIKNFNQFSRGYNSYTYNESAHTEMVEDLILNVTYEDGKWSKPYFDCGGGNIWMMTYTVPFFDYQNETYFFKGTSGIDIDLRRVDIDQCPLPKNSTELNIFAASDKCKNATTKCVAIKGLGFRRGSYQCHCKDGFYFPNVSSPLKFFNGTLLEEEYENKFMGRLSRYDAPGAFECLLCPYGCDTCVDDRPCVVSLNWLMRSAILILQVVIILTLPIVGLFTWKYAEVKVVRAASPVLLRFIVLGAFFIYCTILVMYPSPSIITCTLRVWLREIGFSLAYGALMLKTWRISVIFRVRSAKAVKITDLDLMKRLGIIVAMFTGLLVIRTLVAPPVSIVSLTADDLKAWLCKSDWWDHSFTIIELSFLVWGIRLCIVVRKAPSEFNESKFISLAIYNEFLLSLFLNISMLFLQSPANPDLLYIIFFCHVQLTMTLLLCLIFGSKAYMVFRGHGKGAGSDESRNPTAKFITKNRGTQSNKQSISAQNSTGTGLYTSLVPTMVLQDPNSGPRVPEDLQEEFRRFYSQLEDLKERNLKAGNRTVAEKISIMQATAVTILSAVAETDTNGLSHHSPTSSLQEVGGSTMSSQDGTKTQIKPSLTVRHISEEENGSALARKEKASSLSAPSPNGNNQNNSNASMPAPEKNMESHCSTTSPLPPQLTTTCDVYGNTLDVTPSLSTPGSPSLPETTPTDEEDGLEYVDVQSFEEDEGRNSSHMTPPHQESELNSIHVPEEQEATSQVDRETPVSIITSNACRSLISQLHPPDPALSPEEKMSPVLEVEVESRTGNETQPSLTSTTSPRHQQAASSTGGGTTEGKIILDLDDKSRFTEEITV